jgi:hypothetical protein
MQKSSLCFILACAVLGCTPKNPYLGSWESEVTLMGNRIPLITTFAEQGVASATFEVAGVKAKLLGSYTFEGKERLSVDFKTVELDTKGSLLPESMIKQGREAIDKEMKQPQGGKVKWDSDAAFTVQPDRAGTPVLTFKKRGQ